MAHVDINSYFATLLQQENPHLRGKPIVVTKDIGRTCIIAASKEAKIFGIRTGCLLGEAKKLAPNLIVVGAEFDRYLSATRTLNSIFRSLAPDIQIFSLDEAFIELTNCREHLYPDVRVFGELVQRRIASELGEWVTCNVGLGVNRLQAKLASEIAPKGSIFEVTAENLDGILASVPFSSVCGVGFRLERKLRYLGITTPYMLRLYSHEDLASLVGPFWATELQKISLGEETHQLELIDRHRPMSSVSRSITGWQPAKDEETIKHILYNLTLEVMAKARAMHLVGRSAFISLTGAGGIHEHWGAHITLAAHVWQTRELFEVLYHQLYCNWRRTFPIIRFRVGMAKLQSMNITPRQLWDNWQRSEKVEEAVANLTQRYGLFTVRSGLLTAGQLIRPEVTGFLGDKGYWGLGAN